ncbi:hypothetical protein AKJ09_04969 [Labilithrix luteola]|uniref:Uncharacterized protein n=1 Tax=Labilithrix luteola TaxID=1391654 RepID=A0A0K1PXQ5_9BACT|nr:hypothetical protein [Labilithrix luteola]AKU98305.1 hypothetical protein AKJ09_04969 [Labilithrix luteola]
MGDSAFDWNVKVGCTGGPIMLADLQDFPQWTGAIPFRVLRERSDADAARFTGRQTVLHFWGNLGGAGERFVECDSEEEARAKLDGLRVMAKKNCPDVVITEEKGLTHFRDPASGGELRAELEPQSEYDASWQRNYDADAWIHAFGDGARALFWFVGDDLVHIGQSKARSELILLKHTVASSETAAEDNAAARAYVEAASPGEPVAELTLSTSRLVAIWAPIAPEELDGFDAGAAAAATESTKLGVALDKGIGAVLRVEPGRYVVSLGKVEPSKGEQRPWSARWCRLTRATV